MKVLIHSNAPWVPSGYGQQCMLLAQRLKTEHDVAISAFYGLQGSTLEWEDIVVYPSGSHQYGQDVLAGHAGYHFKGDRGIVITLIDVWVLNGSELRGMPLASWVPLDHQEMPPPIREFFKQSDSIPIAMTRFGQKQLEDNGFQALYAPHGIDTDTFKPLEPIECREHLGIPEDAFVVGMVAANQGTPSRKGFPEAFSALARVMSKYKDIFVYLHTETSGRRGHGLELSHLASATGVPADRVIECDQYTYRTGLLSPTYLARVYNACDVLLNPSYGEGFGIPIIESQACGTPVIATNSSAMPEVVNSGWIVEGHPFYTGLGAFQVIPDVNDLAMTIEMAYHSGGDKRIEAVEFAQQYNADHVYEHHWKPVIESIGESVRSKQIMELEPIR